MSKTLLITGATDGIGKLTAKTLASQGHRVWLHGRNETKLAAVAAELGGDIPTFVADLSDLKAVERMAAQVLDRGEPLDALINNAGVFKTSRPRTADGTHDVRFVVNTLAPYLLTRLLLPALGQTGRVVNLSSAAQAPVDVSALLGRKPLQDMAAYAQSKLAITIWTQDLAKKLPNGPVFIAVNPGSFLATKMVKEGFGHPGHDVGIGADILIRAAIGDAFAQASGRYFDNDARAFGPPHPAARNDAHVSAVMEAIEAQMPQVLPALPA